MVELELQAGNMDVGLFDGGYHRMSRMIPEDIMEEVGPGDEVVLICDNAGDERQDAQKAFQLLRQSRRRARMSTTIDLFRLLAPRR